MFSYCYFPSALQWPSYQWYKRIGQHTATIWAICNGHSLNWDNWIILVYSQLVFAVSYASGVQNVRMRKIIQHSMGRGLLDDDDALSYPGASGACWMRTVLCMLHSVMIKVWSLTSIIGLLFVVMATLSASLAEENARVDWWISGSCSLANTEVLLTYSSRSCLHRYWADVGLLFICACKSSMHASSNDRNASDSAA